MQKELIISIIIVISIFGLNYITQKNTDSAVQTMYESLEKVRNEIIVENPNNETALEHANQACDAWEEQDTKMAYYTEHDELEKVKTALTSVKSFVEVEEYKEGVESIDRCMYILEHIQQKEAINLENVF